MPKGGTFGFWAIRRPVLDDTDREAEAYDDAPVRSRFAAQRAPVLALTRPGFDLGRDPLSLLMLGDGGWMQATNLVLSGLMTLAAALGFSRALASPAGALLGVYGIGLVASGIFPPDPMGGFPPGAPQAATTSGILHLAFGLVQFLALAAAAFVVAGWSARRGDRGTARYSRISGTVVIAGFAGGTALSTVPVGVGLLWLAVVAGWAWLMVASVQAYRTVPHPEADRRAAPDVRPRRSDASAARRQDRSTRCVVTGAQ